MMLNPLRNSSQLKTVKTEYEKQLEHVLDKLQCSSLLSNFIASGLEADDWISSDALLVDKWLLELGMQRLRARAKFVPLLKREQSAEFVFKYKQEFKELNMKQRRNSPTFRIFGWRVFLFFASSEWWYALLKMGAPETLFPLARLIVDLDENGKTLEDAMETVVTETVQAFLNFGIIGALIFGVLFNNLFNNLEASQISIDFFGNYTLKVLMNFYYVLTLLAFIDAIFLIVCSVIFYKHVVSFMFTTELKYQYISKYRCLLLVSLSTQSSLILVALSVVFAVPVFVSPTAGLIVLIISLLGSLLGLLFLYEHDAGGIIDADNAFLETFGKLD